MKCDDIVLLSTADWDNPFWTNKQHVAMELARQGHRVLYVDSIGLRQPSASAADFRRIWKRLLKGLRGTQEINERLWVWSPLVIPLQRYPMIRALNRVLLNVGLRAYMLRRRIRSEIAWTYNPMSTQFFDLSHFGKIVYHCVDEVAAQPGMPSSAIESAERDLVNQCDVCFVTAEHLLATRQKWKRETYYFPNVADYDHFSKAMDVSLAVPSDLASLPGVVIGFIGAISSYKLDFELIMKMASAHPEWSIVLIGKVGEGDPSTNISMLSEFKNIHLLGPRSYDLLPSYLKGFRVAMLPSKLNEYTKGMFPMKFFEYLAAGKPVVATKLHSLTEFTSVCTLAVSHDSFIAGIENALFDNEAALATRLGAAKEQTYRRRTEKMMAIVNELPGKNQGRMS